MFEWMKEGVWLITQLFLIIELWIKLFHLLSHRIFKYIVQVIALFCSSHSTVKRITLRNMYIMPFLAGNINQTEGIHFVQTR